VLDVLAYGPFGLAKKLGELLLAEPDGLTFQPHIELGATVFGLVQDNLAHGFGLLRAHSFSSSFGSRPATVGDQFRDATKMMPGLVTRCIAGLNGTLNCGEKVLPTGISEGFLQVAGKPEFQARFFRVKLHQLIKLALHFDDEVFVHDWGALSGGPFMQLYVVELF
jgi:hypothetical protein